MVTVQVFTFSPIGENTYVLYNSRGKALIIDPGCYFSAEQDTLKNFLESNGLEPVQLLNTHCHLDHVFGNKWVHSQYGLELYLHPYEEEILKVAPEWGTMWGMPFENYAGPLHFLHPGDTIWEGEDELRILFTPGHSPGSISFYNKAQGFIVSGDVLFRESIGRTDFPGCDHEALLKSIREELFVLPGETIVYSGHGPSTTIAYEKKHNPFLKG